MNWITITTNDLNDYLPAALLKALRTKALAVGQADPVPELLGEVITQVRTTLASAGYPLEATPDSVPAVLKTPVAFLTIALAQTRLPGLALTTEQRAQVADAKAMLTRISRRDVAIEAPTTPDTTSLSTPSGTIRVVTSRDISLRITSKDLKNLN